MTRFGNKLHRGDTDRLTKGFEGSGRVTGEEGEGEEGGVGRRGRRVETRLG